MVTEVDGRPGTERSRYRYETISEAMGAYTGRQSPPTKETLLREYDFLRSEITTSLSVQVQILSFGTATLGLVAGAAFVGSADAFRSSVLVVFLPLLAYLALTVWFSEVMRMLRAGGFLLVIEKRLDELGDGSLEWEARVWKGRLKYSIIRPYYGVLDPDQLRLFSVTLLFFTLAGASVALGWDGATLAEQWFAIGAGIVSFTVIVLLYNLRIDQLADMLEIDERPAIARSVDSLVRRVSRVPDA